MEESKEIEKLKADLRKAIEAEEAAIIKAHQEKVEKAEEARIQELIAQRMATKTKTPTK